MLMVMMSILIMLVMIMLLAVMISMMDTVSVRLLDRSVHCRWIFYAFL